jgi:hypothetical protein
VGSTGLGSIDGRGTWVAVMLAKAVRAGVALARVTLTWVALAWVLSVQFAKMRALRAGVIGEVRI